VKSTGLSMVMVIKRCHLKMHFGIHMVVPVIMSTIDTDVTSE